MENAKKEDLLWEGRVGDTTPPPKLRTTTKMLIRYADRKLNDHFMMALNFELNDPTSNGRHSTFRDLFPRKKLNVLFSKVQNLLLYKILRSEKFVSVAV